MLLALLLAAAQPAINSPLLPPVAGRPEAPIRADSMELARILNPEGPMVEMITRNFSDSMRSVIESNEDYRTLEQDYPGISKAMVESMTEAMRADAIADLPHERRRYARLYAEHFTPGETAELMHFYTSSAGQRLIAAKFAKLDVKPLMAEFTENPDAEVSQQHIRAMNRAATSTIVGEMSPDDRAALLAFAKSPVFVKLAAARGAIQKLEADIANEPDPQLDKALEAAADAVMAKFTGDKRPTP
jgi:hypothetical protein